MPISKKNLIKAARLVGEKHARFIAMTDRRQDRFEEHWKAVANQTIESVHNRVVEEILSTGEIPKNVDFTDLIMRHYLESVAAAIGVAESELEFLKAPEVRMGKPSKPDMPRSLFDIRVLYDKYRKGKIPARQKELADKIKKQYLQKVADVWKKYSAEFRSGADTFNQDEAKEKLKSAAKITKSRANMIVETETTNYYNKTRRQIYDQSAAVTHYLFLAIRDQGTTKWCTDKVTKGKRGRHGLVYSKDDPLTKRETPAIHWNCRSEMVPLVPYNTRHKRLIEDESLHRRNHTCHPLPEGWNK